MNRRARAWKAFVKSYKEGVLPDGSPTAAKYQTSAPLSDQLTDCFILLLMLLAVAGIAGLVYFAAYYKISVTTEAGEIANLSLMSHRNAGLICSAVALLLGVVLLINLLQRRK